MMKLTPALPSAPLPSPRRRRRRRPFFPRAGMSSSSSSSQAEQAAGASDFVPPLPTNRIVLGCGAASLDYLATVAALPKPDDEIRSTSLKVEEGRNAGNPLTSAARLGLNPGIISKVANDAQGEMQLRDLKLKALIPPVCWKTRTCIHTPGYPEMMPEDLSQPSLCSALDGASLVHFDGRFPETALAVAKEIIVALF